MIGQLALIVAGCALATIAFAVTVARSYRRGVGVIARDFGDGRIVFLSTQILDDSMFRPGARDDGPGWTWAIDNYLITDEAIRRYGWISVQTDYARAHVTLTGLV